VSLEFPKAIGRPDLMGNSPSDRMAEKKGAPKMAIKEHPSLSYWNYYLALEADLAALSRYVEFTKENFHTYSIEMAHLLLTTASEVDVVIKQHCAQLAPDEKVENICQYRKVLRPLNPALEKTKVFLPRFGLELIPWKNWQKDKTPCWWSDHADVKHCRGDHYTKANLGNVLNAVGGLFLLLIMYYREDQNCHKLVPRPALFKAPDELIKPGAPLDGEPGLFIRR